LDDFLNKKVVENIPIPWLTFELIILDDFLNKKVVENIPIPWLTKNVRYGI